LLKSIDFFFSKPKMSDTWFSDLIAAGQSQQKSKSKKKHHLRGIVYGIVGIGRVFLERVGPACFAFPIEPKRPVDISDREYILLRDVEHCGTSSAHGTNSI
jgi:hypothetical protein